MSLVHSAGRNTGKSASDAGRDSALTRRQFLGAGAAATAAGVLPLGWAQHLLGGEPAGSPNFDPQLVLLLDRLTGGFSLAEYQHAESLGYEGYLAEQLDYLQLIGANDPDLETRLNPPSGPYDILPMTAKQIRDMYQPNNMSNIAYRQTSTVQLMWAVYAKAQLYYRMFQFWNHHLNIDLNSDGAQRFILFPFLRDAVLANAMTNVPDLILGSAYGSAMLYYLNNNTNVASAPNENYSRELMELHTLGVDNGYDQSTIEELARVLTGWSVCLSGGGCSSGTYEYGEFRFISGNHDTGDKTLTIEGFDYAIQGLSGSGAVAEGEEALAILTSHPNTADFIARKLCRFFLGGINYEYDPPEDIVQMVKWTYLNSNPMGDIVPMLEIILHRDVLTNMAVPKFRRPYDLTTAALRAVGGEMTPVSTSFLPDIRFAMESMGMHPSFWGPPNGPYDSKNWSEGSIISRWTYVDRVAGNNYNDIADFTVTSLLQQVDATAPGTQGQGLNEILTGGRMTTKEVDALQEFIDDQGASENTLKEALGLAMSLPTYQFI